MAIDPVIVVGGGLAGLSAAIHLAERGVEVTLLEAGPRLGGKLAGRPPIEFTHAGRSFRFADEHGMHAIWAQYFNMKALLERAGCRERFRPARPASILFRKGDETITQPLDFAYAEEKSPLWFLSELLTTRNTLVRYRLSDVPMLARCLFELVTFEPVEDEAAEDEETVAEFSARHRLTEEMAAILEGVLKAGSFDHNRFVSLAWTKSLLSFAMLGHVGDIRFELLRGDSDANLVRPLARYAAELGVRLVRGAKVTEVLREGGRASGVRVEPSGAPAADVPPYAPGDLLTGPATLDATAVVLAVEVPALQRLLDPGLLADPFFSRLRRLEAIDNWVVRVFTDRPLREDRADSGTFAGGFQALDNFFVLSRFNDECRTYRRDAGGEVIEFHSYLARHLLPGLTDDERRDLFVRDVLRAFPELEGGIVHVAFHRNDATFTRVQARSHAHMATVTTPVPGLLLAGDHVQVESPAFDMERATLSGIVAANAILKERGLPLQEVRHRRPDLPTTRALKLARRVKDRLLGPRVAKGPPARAPRAPQNRAPKVLVVGAGLAGLSAAISLAERGLDVTVLEREAQPGGKVRSREPVRFHHRDRLWRFPTDFGMHGVWRRYHNLKELLRRAGAGGALVPGAPSELVYARPGAFEVRRQTIHFRGFPLPAPLHVAKVLLFGNELFTPTPKDLRDMLRLSVELGGHDELRDAAGDDAETLAGLIARHGLREELGALLEGIAKNGTFERASRVSAAFAKNLLAFDALGTQDACEVEWVKGPTGAHLAAPLARFAAARGAKLHTGTELLALHRGEGGAIAEATYRTGGETRREAFDHVVLAVEIPGLQKLLRASGLEKEPGLEGVLRLEALDQLVVRMWFADARLASTRAQSGALAGAFRLFDNYFVLSRIQDEYRAWSEETDGEVIECQVYLARDRARTLSPAQLRAEAEVEIGRVFPELAGKLVHLHVQENPPLFSGRSPGHVVDAPSTATGLDNLYVAGDFVRLPHPVHDMEKAVVSGRVAANAILAREGYPSDAVIPLEPPTVAHRLLSALRGAGILVPARKDARALDAQRERPGLKVVEEAAV